MSDDRPTMADLYEPHGCTCGPRAADPEHGCTCGYADWIGER